MKNIFKKVERGLVLPSRGMLRVGLDDYSILAFFFGFARISA